MTKKEYTTVKHKETGELLYPDGILNKLRRDYNNLVSGGYIEGPKLDLPTESSTTRAPTTTSNGEPQQHLMEEPQQHLMEEPQHLMEEPQQHLMKEPQQHLMEEPQQHLMKEPQQHLMEEPQQHLIEELQLLHQLVVLQTKIHLQIILD